MNSCRPKGQCCSGTISKQVGEIIPIRLHVGDIFGGVGISKLTSAVFTPEDVAGTSNLQIVSQLNGEILPGDIAITTEAC